MSKVPRIGSLSLGNVEGDSDTIDPMPSLGLGELDSEHGVALKDWSAQDFALIYVRFRPHLISHARRFLTEESRAEEVVQDAFLYLMTALPELDSELGVLRFLKWKTKMLCLDVIRSSSSGHNGHLSSLPDDVPDSSQELDFLERAEDAALVQIALAKLSPRQRAAIVSTVFEEKSNREAAHELGLSENAFRQLLLRARRAFRQVFVGEAAAKNLTVAEALQLASSRAPAFIRNSSVGLLALIVFLGPLGLGLQPESRVALKPLASSISERDPLPQSAPPSFESSQPGSTDTSTVARQESNYETEFAEYAPKSSLPELTTESLNLDPTREEMEDGVLRNPESINFARQLLEDVTSATLRQSVEPRTFSMVGDSGIQITGTLGTDSQSLLQSLVIRYVTDDHDLIAIPMMTGETLVGPNHYVVATGFVVGDLRGNAGGFASGETYFSELALGIQIELAADGTLVSASVEFIPRNPA